ncbi:glycoside hydrolase domain-containing protein [Lentisphaerota bacterium WC36G]|nr:DUF6067 family protein [Lentisphaerae bacterium WC36]
MTKNNKEKIRLMSTTIALGAMLFSSGGCFSSSDETLVNTSYKLYHSEKSSIEIEKSQDTLKYGIGNWTKSFGNHRIVVEVPEPLANAKAVQVEIPWRRDDDFVATKDVVIRDSNNKIIKDKYIISEDNEKGLIAFKPTQGAGTYYFYHFAIMPQPKWYMTRYFATTRYIKRATKKSAWAQKYVTDDLPYAEVVRAEARNKFESFYPMQVIATAEEVKELTESYGKDNNFMVFPEVREHPIVMTENIPTRWLNSSQKLSLSAFNNEYFAFQIGIYALKDIKNIEVKFSDLCADNGNKISNKALTCFNLTGSNYDGKPMNKVVNVPKNRVQALWFGIDITPEAVKPGTYYGNVRISEKDSSKRPKWVPIKLTVSENLIANRGDDEPWRHSRLRWLNSKIGLNDNLVAPYTKVKLNETTRTVNILGRQIKFSKAGLPTSVKSFIDLDKIKTSGREILASPMRLEIEDENGNIEQLKGLTFQKTYQADGKVSLLAISDSKNFTVTTTMSPEMDGYIRYRFSVKNKTNINLKDVRLVMPLKSNVAKYFKGVYKKPACLTPENYSSTMKHGLYVNGFWLGDYNVGIAFKPKNDIDEMNPDRNTRHKVPYPIEWSNNNQGKYTLTKKDNNVTEMVISSGARKLTKKEQSFNLNFALYVTPFKPIKKEHWDYRYYHNNCGWDPQLYKAKDAKVVNVHHGGSANPWINYPFLTINKMQKIAKEVHGRGQKVKFYNTVRELSVRAPELYALRSLNGEVLLAGEGHRELQEKPFDYQKPHKNRGGQAWLAEHLKSNYRSRWHNPIQGSREISDASLGVKGLSRFHNYYLEGIDYLVRTVDIDGLYLDGIGYDRSIMKRVRKALDKSKSGNLIDFHETPFPNLEHIPYVDSIWFGEGANYSRNQAYWLVEVSGIPFGVTGEVLKHHASNYKAFVYGMWKRDKWSGNPKGLWKFLDKVKIKDTETIGYWMENCPVSTDQKDVLASAFVKKGEYAIVAVASWNKAKNGVKTLLNIDWDKLGLNENDVTVTLPAIDHFQKANPNFSLTKAINLKNDEGYVIVIKKK